MRDKGQDPENQLRQLRAWWTSQTPRRQRPRRAGKTRSATVADLSHSTSICRTVRGHRRSSEPAAKLFPGQGKEGVAYSLAWLDCDSPHQ
jgi:hypothetical protein